MYTAQRRVHISTSSHNKVMKERNASNRNGVWARAVQYIYAQCALVALYNIFVHTRVSITQVGRNSIQSNEKQHHLTVLSSAKNDEKLERQRKGKGQRDSQSYFFLLLFTSFSFDNKIQFYTVFACCFPSIRLDEKISSFNAHHQNHVNICANYFSLFVRSFIVVGRFIWLFIYYDLGYTGIGHISNSACVYLRLAFSHLCRWIHLCVRWSGPRT